MAPADAAGVLPRLPPVQRPVPFPHLLTHRYFPMSANVNNAPFTLSRSSSRGSRNSTPSVHTENNQHVFPVPPSPGTAPMTPACEQPSSKFSSGPRRNRSGSELAGGRNQSSDLFMDVAALALSPAPRSRRRASPSGDDTSQAESRVHPVVGAPASWSSFVRRRSSQNQGPNHSHHLSGPGSNQSPSIPAQALSQSLGTSPSSHGLDTPTHIGAGQSPLVQQQFFAHAQK